MTDSADHPDATTWWSEASPALRRVLERTLSPLKLNAGQTLFDQGDEDDRLYVLDDGVLEVSVLSVDGRKLSLNQMRSGHVFGEIAVFDPGPRTARVGALTACKLRAVRHAALMDAVAQEPRLVADLLRIAGKRMRWMSQQVEEQVFLTPASRLAAKIVHLAGDRAEIKMSQAQLADYVGVTREIVSKTLNTWRRAGVLEVTRGRIAILDRDALEDIRDADLL